MLVTHTRHLAKTSHRLMWGDWLNNLLEAFETSSTQANVLFHFSIAWKHVTIGVWLLLKRWRCLLPVVWGSECTAPLSTSLLNVPSSKESFYVHNEPASVWKQPESTSKRYAFAALQDIFTHDQKRYFIFIWKSSTAVTAVATIMKLRHLGDLLN